MFVQTHFQRNHRHHNTANSTASSSNSQTGAARAAACSSSVAAAATSAPAATNPHPGVGRLRSVLAKHSPANTTTSTSNNSRSSSPSQSAVSALSAAPAFPRPRQESSAPPGRASALASGSAPRASAGLLSAAPEQKEAEEVPPERANAQSIAKRSSQPRGRSKAPKTVGDATATTAGESSRYAGSRQDTDASSDQQYPATSGNCRTETAGGASAAAVATVVRQRGRLQRSENSIGGGEGSFVSQRRRRSEPEQPEQPEQPAQADLGLYSPVEVAPIEEVGCHCCDEQVPELSPPPVPPRQAPAEQTGARPSQARPEGAEEAGPLVGPPASEQHPGCHWCEGADRNRAPSGDFEASSLDRNAVVVARQAHVGRRQRQQQRLRITTSDKSPAGSAERSILRSLIGAPLLACCRSLASSSLFLASGKAPASEGELRDQQEELLAASSASSSGLSGSRSPGSQLYNNSSGGGGGGGGGRLALFARSRRNLGLAAAFCVHFVAYQLETWLLLAGAGAPSTATAPPTSTTSAAESGGHRSRHRSTRHHHNQTQSPECRNQSNERHLQNSWSAAAIMMPPSGATEAQATFYRQLSLGAGRQQSGDSQPGSQCLCRHHRHRREMFSQHQLLLDDIQDSTLGDSLNDTSTTTTDQALGYLFANYPVQSQQSHYSQAQLQQQFGGDFHRRRSSTIGGASGSGNNSCGGQQQFASRGRPHGWPSMPAGSAPWPPSSLIKQQQQHSNYGRRLQATGSVGLVGHLTPAGREEQPAALAIGQSSQVVFGRSLAGVDGGSLPSSSIGQQQQQRASSNSSQRASWHWNSNSESFDFSLEEPQSVQVESDSGASSKSAANAASATALLASQRQQQQQQLFDQSAVAAAGYEHEREQPLVFDSSNQRQQHHHYYRESSASAAASPASSALTRLIQQHSQGCSQAASRQVQRHLYHQQQHSLQRPPQLHQVPQAAQQHGQVQWLSESQAHLVGVPHQVGVAAATDGRHQLHQRQLAIGSDSELYARYRQPIMATAAAVIKPFQASPHNLEAAQEKAGQLKQKQLAQPQAPQQRQLLPQQRRLYEHSNSAESPGERELRTQRRQQTLPVGSKSTDSTGSRARQLQQQVEARDSRSGGHADGDGAEQQRQAATSHAAGSGAKLLTANSKKGASPGKLSLAGAKRRLGFKKKGLSSLSVQRSEEIGPLDASHLVRQMTANSLTDSGNESGSYWLSQSQTTHSSTDPRACFVEGLGAGQIASRQALVSPYLGDIQLSLSDRRGMLEVEVVRARQLQTKPEAKTLPSPYVKVYLMRNKKCVGKFKTSTARKTLDPLYQQLFTFRDDYTGCVLQAIVWGDYGKKDKKSLMGIVQIHLSELDISNVVIGWYKLFNVPSMASSAASSKALRQTILTSKSVECQ